MKSKKIIILIIISLLLIFQMNIVQAALQSNGDKPATKLRDNWMVETRKMENLGGGFGLEEEQNENLEAKGETNNIDIHMQKNTEFGAMALLSASSYGNPKKIEDKETTTGNKSGVLILYQSEWTAANFIKEGGTLNFAGRYINYYTVENKQKNGDATIETQGWHGSEYGYVYNQYIGQSRGALYALAGAFVRWNTGIFSYSNHFTNRDTAGDTYYGPAYGTNSYATRAVIVNGDGI